MSFKFRLQKVLEYRKTMENLARKSYLEALAELNDAKDVIEKYYNQIHQSQLRRHQIISLGNNPSEELSQIFNYIKGIELKIERQKIVIRDLLAKVENLQHALQEASTEYKMIEKLEVRKHEEYKVKEKKIEEKKLNEMGLINNKLRMGHE